MKKQKKISLKKVRCFRNSIIFVVPNEAFRGDISKINC